jgi:hypothetical protein
MFFKRILMLNKYLQKAIKLKFNLLIINMLYFFNCIKFLFKSVLIRENQWIKPFYTEGS